MLEDFVTDFWLYFCVLLFLCCVNLTNNNNNNIHFCCVYMCWLDEEEDMFDYV